MQKKKILIFSDWYFPGFKAGGPIKSIRNLCTALKDDFDFYIFTGDRDLGDEKPYPGIQADSWNEVEGINVFYASPGQQNLKAIKKAIHSEEFSSYYFNSLFSVKFTLLPLLYLKFKGYSEKAILAPRGMLGPGALQIKPVKKHLFLSFARAFGLFENITWHATSEQEKKEIQAIFGKRPFIKVAMNIPSMAKAAFIPKEKQKGEARLFFLSRISPKKNLQFALSILQDVKEGKIFFDIYGPAEDSEYWEECKKEMQSLPANISVTYKGAVKPEEIPGLTQYHALFLTSMNENFGHVMPEALALGSLLLISDQSPWKGLKEKGIGWEIPLYDKPTFLDAICTLVDMDEAEFNACSEKCVNYFNNLPLTESFEDYKKLFGR
jgi:glycosyltransferase involved in cell wall biosynthesis